MNTDRIITKDSCVGCNLCILSCPCDEANVAYTKDGLNKVSVDASKCITCGECLRVCTHEARDYVDDTDRFFEKLKEGENISLIVAPALRCNVPNWPGLLGYLKTLGVNMIYDASYGADICTWGYLRYIAENNAQGVISQPCPTIVNYIEHYIPESLARLAPIHSPAMCTAIFMKKYKNIPGSYAFLSPCVAKGDEFDDPNTYGLVEYNVTFNKLLEYLDKNGIDYRKNSPAEYDSPPHSLGAVYSNPGGLKTNVGSYVQGEWIFKIEGLNRIKSFLHEYVNKRSDGPFLVDILSCGGGCNSGSGACLTQQMEYDIDKAMHKVQREIEANKDDLAVSPDFDLFDKQLRLDDFRRQYTPKKIMPIFVDRHEMECAFAALNKPTHEFRVTDCRACGFSTCQEMAVAIAKGINHADNCVDYLRSLLKKEAVTCD